MENFELNIEREKPEVLYEMGASNVNTMKYSPENSSSYGSSILDACNTSTIDDEIQKMHTKLEESSKLFQEIGERFENINFNCLKSRIRDLHLNDRSNSVIKDVFDDLKNSFDAKYKQNRLENLTKEVTAKFREHPGEFGNIPELSTFFKTCTQLQQGLEKLQKLKDSCQNLERKMFRVAEASYDRVIDIQSKINEETEAKDI